VPGYHEIEQEGSDHNIKKTFDYLESGQQLLVNDKIVKKSIGKIDP
jgi:hypothetical protein